LKTGPAPESDKASALFSANEPHVIIGMATDAKWGLSRKNCHTECIYSEIPSDTSYFLPKKPQIPPKFKHKWENCGHEDTYEGSDLSYRDETMPSRVETKKCAEFGEPSPCASGAGR
jgi:hypothetical protein